MAQPAACGCLHCRLARSSSTTTPATLRRGGRFVVHDSGGRCARYLPCLWFHAACLYHRATAHTTTAALPAAGGWFVPAAPTRNRRATRYTAYCCRVSTYRGCHTAALHLLRRGWPTFILRPTLPSLPATACRTRTRRNAPALFGLYRRATPAVFVARALPRCSCTPPPPPPPDRRQTPPPRWRGGQLRAGDVLVTTPACATPPPTPAAPTRFYRWFKHAIPGQFRIS